ncbi:MAG: ATP-binding cassette domain-containing protein, partial [Candidatus Thorarchaeota archaeon]
MTSDIESMLKELNREELLELAHTKKIKIPKNWSNQFITELLSLNVEVGEIQKSRAKSKRFKEKPEMAPIIIIKDLQKKFENVTAIDGLNLEIRKGELFSLLGPNGAGKTTTLNILTGIVQPTKGSAVIDGFDVAKNGSEVKKIIGVCPQEAAVHSFLNARENIELFGKLHSLPRNQIKERADR